MPLDFNAFADSDGNVDKKRVILTTLTHPWKIPGLIRLGARSSLAAKNLAAFLEAYLTTLSLILILSVLFFLNVPSCHAQPKPLSQTEAVTIAMQQSPQARVAHAVWLAARTQAGRDKPQAQPTLTAVASGTAQGPRVTLPSPDYRTAVVLPEGAGRLDLILEQTLYHAGIGAARQRYAAEIALAKEDYLKTLADLAQSVRKAYMDVLRAESGVRIAQEGVDGAARYQQLVLQQIQAGTAKPIDAETVIAQVAEATSGLRKAESGVDLARKGFNYALGRPLGTAFALVPLEPPATPKIVPAEVDTAIAYAQQNRPELVTLELNLRLAQAGVSLARTQAQPTIAARGQFTEQTPTALAHEHYYGATIEIRFPLLDGGKMRQDTREAQAQVSRLLAERDLARLGIELDVQRAWSKIRDANDQISSTGKQRVSQEKMLAVTEKAYEVGKGTAQEVQIAQRETRSARERELQSLYDLAAAIIDFAHAQGRDLRETEAFIGKK